MENIKTPSSFVSIISLWLKTPSPSISNSKLSLVDKKYLSNNNVLEFLIKFRPLPEILPILSLTSNLIASAAWTISERTKERFASVSSGAGVQELSKVPSDKNPS